MSGLDQFQFIGVKSGVQEFPVEPGPEGTGLPGDGPPLLVIELAVQDIPADDQDPIPIPGQNDPSDGFRSVFQVVVLLIETQGKGTPHLGFADLPPFDLHSFLPAGFIRKASQQGISGVFFSFRQEGVRTNVLAGGDHIAFPQFCQESIGIIKFLCLQEGVCPFAFAACDRVVSSQLFQESIG